MEKMFKQLEIGNFYFTDTESGNCDYVFYYSGDDRIHYSTCKPLNGILSKEHTSKGITNNECFNPNSYYCFNRLATEEEIQLLISHYPHLEDKRNQNNIFKYSTY